MKKFKLKKVFFDANVILDIFDEKRAFHKSSYGVLITTIYYVLKKIDK